MNLDTPEHRALESAYIMARNRWYAARDGARRMLARTPRDDDVLVRREYEAAREAFLRADEALYTYVRLGQARKRARVRVGVYRMSACPERCPACAMPCAHEHPHPEVNHGCPSVNCRVLTYATFSVAEMGQEEPEPESDNMGPEVDDEGGMSEYGPEAPYEEHEGEVD